MGQAKNRMMELESRGFGEVQGWLCLAHVLDETLAARLSADEEALVCRFCGREASSEDDAPFAVSFEALLYEFMETVRHFYEDANEVLPWDSEEGGFIGPQSNTSEVVDDIASGVLDADVAEIIIEALVEAIGTEMLWTEFSARGDVDDLEYAWNEFAETARHTSRFVISMTADPWSPPGRLYRFLERLLVYVGVDLDLTIQLPEGSKFYRGRLCESPRQIRRDSRDLGSAPGDVASANRMSPAGIALFYASGDPETAVAEIGGHGVEQFAVIGEFTNLKPLRILDLTRTPPPISRFDLARREQARMARFLKSFVMYVTEPVIPDGRQHIEYAPTQLLTEFLRWVSNPKLDGIALPSAQTGRRTYVLFFGPNAFMTKGDGAPENVTFLNFNEEIDRGILFELDPGRVMSYRIHRAFEAQDAGSFYRAAEPRYTT